MNNVCIIGCGHVGLVTGASLAELGNKVICVDNNTRVIDGLKEGKMPFYEPGLEELVHRNANNGRLSFTTGIEEGVKASEIIFIAVGTPQKPDETADMTLVEAVIQEISQTIDEYKVVVEKSTVPVKTGKWIGKKFNSNRGVDCDVVSNPEFLREGSALNDFMNPDRIVIGTSSERVIRIMTELYRPLKAPIVITDIVTAELIKHASNCFLALKISFINAVATICEKTGGDVVKVAEGCDALIIITEWDELRDIDLKRIKLLLRQSIIIDGRNIYDLQEMKKLGFTYCGTGR